jgi:hypothetical protein
MAVEEIGYVAPTAHVQAFGNPSVGHRRFSAQPSGYGDLGFVAFSHLVEMFVSATMALEFLGYNLRTSVV